MALTDADKRAWTQLLDGIAATIEKWRKDRQQVEQVCLVRKYIPLASAMHVHHSYEYAFPLVNMDNLKLECYGTIDAMIRMKEAELKQKTEEFNNLLKQ